VRVVTLQERPDLADAAFPDTWPEFMYHDAVADGLYGAMIAAFPQFSLVGLAGDGEPVAKAVTLPFTGRLDALPDNGYDAIILGAAADRATGRTGTLVGAVEVTVQVDRRGTGLSGLMLDAVRRNARRLGFDDVVVALRPNRKHLHPHLPLHAYVRQVRDDGLPIDPWLRTHVRAGGRIVGVAPRSMTITGALAEWRAWTGLPFDTDGEVLVPQALTPVRCDLSADLAVYIEPNVWIHHPLAGVLHGA
jgi:hypothetical protein